MTQTQQKQNVRTKKARIRNWLINHTDIANQLCEFYFLNKAFYPEQNPAKYLPDWWIDHWGDPPFPTKDLALLTERDMNIIVTELYE